MMATSRDVRFAPVASRFGGGRIDAMCHSRPNAAQQKHRYSITSSGRASSGRERNREAEPTARASRCGGIAHKAWRRWQL
jgi:hypothetical protein